jgi:hypothetical protein
MVKLVFYVMFLECLLSLLEAISLEFSDEKWIQSIGYEHISF